MRSKFHPRAVGVKQVVVPDDHNPAKSHVFRIYPSRNVYYNQAINGALFYSKFEICRHGHGYYHYFQKINDPTGTKESVFQKRARTILKNKNEAVQIVWDELRARGLSR